MKRIIVLLMLITALSITGCGRSPGISNGATTTLGHMTTTTMEKATTTTLLPEIPNVDDRDASEIDKDLSDLENI